MYWTNKMYRSILHTMTKPLTISVLDARKSFSDLLNKTAYGEDRIRISRHGKPIAALVSIRDLELLEALESRADLDLIERIEQEATAEDFVRWEEVRDKL